MSNLSTKCTKLRQENYKGDIRHRCTHRASDVFSQEVHPDQCAACEVFVQSTKVIARDTKNIPIKPVIEPERPVGCPYLHKAHGKTLCSLTGLSTDAETCERCDSETRKYESSGSGKVVRYLGAIRRWVVNGRPTRTSKEIHRLFEQNCKQCVRFDSEKHSCKSCGCSVNTSGTPLANKLAMATERCPLGRF